MMSELKSRLIRFGVKLRLGRLVPAGHRLVAFHDGPEDVLRQGAQDHVPAVLQALGDHPRHLRDAGAGAVAALDDGGVGVERLEDQTGVQNLPAGLLEGVVDRRGDDLHVEPVVADEHQEPGDDLGLLLEVGDLGGLGRQLVGALGDDDDEVGVVDGGGAVRGFFRTASARCSRAAATPALSRFLRR